MEQRDLYDINRNLTNETIYKGEKIPKDRYILVVLAIIRNSKGEFLIQKRSLQKDGKYGSTGGHAKSGESSIEAMLTEIKEELGLTLNKEELQLVFSGREDSSQVFFDLYYLEKDIDLESLTLQREEVDFVKWLSLNEIEMLIEDGLFLENHIEELYRVIDILKLEV